MYMICLISNLFLNVYYKIKSAFVCLNLKQDGSHLKILFARSHNTQLNKIFICYMLHGRIFLCYRKGPFLIVIFK